MADQPENILMYVVDDDGKHCDETCLFRNDHKTLLKQSAYNHYYAHLQGQKRINIKQFEPISKFLIFGKFAE